MLYVQKTKYMLFSYKGNYRLQPIRFDAMDVECVSSIRYLGLIFDSNLNFKSHIDTIASKMSKNVGIMCKVSNFLPRNVLLSIYYAIIHPYLNYCIEAWYSGPQFATNKLFVLQKRAIRIITGAYHLDHTVELFKELKILTLKNVYLCNMGTYLYKCINLVNFDVDLLEYVNAHTNQHHYVTRANSQITLPLYSRTRSQSSIYYQGCKIWNGIDAAVRDSQTVSSFRFRFRHSLLSA